MKYRFLLLAICGFFLFHNSFAQSAIAPDGDGSIDNPYLISSLENLYWLSEKQSVWTGGYHFEQTADIDATPTRNLNDGSGFSPIGVFTGNYNGKGHVINGLFINRINEDSIGLFKSVSTGIIDSLGLINCAVTGNDCVGGIAGSVNDASINYCFTSGSVSGESNVGGLYGLDTDGFMSYSYSACSVYGNDYVGGLVGNGYSGGIYYCYYTGSAYGDNNVGGFLGYVYGVDSRGANVYNVSCGYNNGSVYGGSGILGYDGGQNYEIYYDYETGNGQYVYFSSVSIDNCYVSASVSDGAYIGASNYIGDDYGFREVSAVYNCYYNAEVITSVQDDENSEVALSNQLMQSFNSFKYWDFMNTWAISTGFNSGYPVFLWQLDSIIKPELKVASAVFHNDSISAVLGCSFSSLGIPNPVQYGFCYSSNLELPTVLTSDTTCIGGVNGFEEAGYFEDELLNISADSIYFIRAYAINVADTVYSNVVMLGDIQVPDVFDGLLGKGTEEQPYLIASIEDLRLLSETDSVWAMGLYFKQTADINASETKNWNQGLGFSPVGNCTDVFNGFYTGGGHIIDSLFISNPSGIFSGFFGYVSGGKIDSLGITNCNINGNNNVGALAGEIVNSSVIFQCYCSGDVSGNNNVGGLTGISQDLSSVCNCYSLSSSSGVDCVGGLVGSNSNSSVILNCYSNGIVSASSNLGGLVGTNSNADVLNSCYNAENSGILSGIGFDDSNQVVDSYSIKEMQSFATFNNLNFAGLSMDGSDKVWAISSGINNGYPVLMWQIAEVKAPQLANIEVSFGTDGTGVTLKSSFVFSGIPNPVFYGFCYSKTNVTPNVLGSDTTCLGAINGCETADEFTDEIQGIDLEQIYYLRAYAINAADTVYSSNVVKIQNNSTSVTEDGKNSITIYPNPVSSVLYVDGGTGLAVIYNAAGEEIMCQNLNQSNTIDVTGLETGIYILKVDEKVFKVIKR